MSNMTSASEVNARSTFRELIDTVIIVDNWVLKNNHFHFLCWAYKNPDDLLVSSKKKTDEEIDAIIDDEPPAAESASDEVMKLDLYHFSFPQKAVDEEGIRIAVPHDSRLFLCIFRRHMILMADPSLINQLIRFGAKTITVQGI